MKADKDVLRGDAPKTAARRRPEAHSPVLGPPRTAVILAARRVSKPLARLPEVKEEATLDLGLACIFTEFT